MQAKVPFLEFDKNKRGNFINSLSGYKSANLVGTINAKNITNLSLISSAFHLGADPALIGFIIRPDSVPRHTLLNLRENKLCTLNHVHKAMIEQAHQTSARYADDQSEFLEVGLTEEFYPGFGAPFVQESKLKMACEMREEIKIQQNGTHLIVCEIMNVFMPESIISNDGYVDLEQIDSVAISGLDSYHEVKKLFRLSYAKPNKELRKI